MSIDSTDIGFVFQLKWEKNWKIQSEAETLSWIQKTPFSHRQGGHFKNNANYETISIKIWHFNKLIHLFNITK